MTGTKRNAVKATGFIATLCLLGVGQLLFGRLAAEQAQSAVQAPHFEVDPLWPKPLPNHWILGSTIGLGVDERDHIWIVHRGIGSGLTALAEREIYAMANPPQALCCVPAPPVLEFDAAGNLLSHWGGPGEGYEWPESNHGITPDTKGNLWIGGNGANDGQILKFTREGKFVRQFGFAWANASSNDPWAFRQVAKVFVDDARNEAYVADGYGNHRVAVIDTNTGQFKRHWGAYGNKPDDTNLGRYDPSAPPAQQFRNPVHCSELSRDGFVYVCDRPNDRIQVFTREGKFVKEVFVEKNTRGDGSVWDIAFSRDAEQKYMYVADGADERIHVFDRQSLSELTNFGDGGRQPGQFFGVHSIATDSRGNLYTTETYEGKRVQRFLYKGLRPVTKKDQGPAWP